MSQQQLPIANMLPYKRVKLDDRVSSKVIGTHSGSFQADEAMGVFLLRQLPEYRNSIVIRSRDIPLLEEKADIIIDVGGIYDHDKKRYDHHQRNYDERFTPDSCTKLSASGLVYRHYGKDVLRQYYPALSPDMVDLAYLKIYDKLMKPLDAIDTGVEMVPDGVEALYYDSTGLSSRVGRLNPRWNEVNNDRDDNNKNNSIDDNTTKDGKPDPDQRFEMAVELCGQDFCSVMTSIIEADLPARSFVEEALLKRNTTDASGQIICLNYGGMPWRNHLYELEKIHNVEQLVKFVLYTDDAGMWRVQAVTVEGKAFVNRLSLPEAWRGVRDQDLAGIANIKTARFVHVAGFIGGADEYEDALAMAREAIRQQQQQ